MKDYAELFQYSKIYRDDPQRFFREALGCELWGRQLDIVISVRDTRKTVTRSSNAVGKTFTAAQLALWFLVAFPPAVVVNTAPTSRQVRNQFWREFRKAHAGARMKLGGKLLKTQFDIAEDWFAIGFTSPQGEGGMEKFQGWHGKHLLFIIDEGSGVGTTVWQAIEGSMSGGEIVRMAAFGNPTQNTGEFHDAFSDPSFSKFHISAFDSPNVKEGRTVIPGLATLAWVEDMRRKYGEDSPVYQVRVKGDFPSDDGSTFIPLSLVESAICADREQFGDEEVIGLDVARFGANKTVFVHRKGNRAKVLKKLSGADTMQTAGAAKQFLRDFPNASLRIDTVGVGGGVFDRLREQPDVAGRVEGVNVGTPAIDKEAYFNLRSEGWGLVKSWLRDGVLDDDDDWNQLAAPKYRLTSKGQYQIESKDDMVKRGVQSPDVADALILTLVSPTDGGAQTVTWL